MKIATGFLLWAICATTASAMDLVSDPAFCQGFYVKDRTGKDQVLRWKDTLGRDQNQTPVWRTAQHDSKSCFADAAFCKFRNGGLTFRDHFQTLIAHPEDGQADIILGVNAMKEYGGVWRKPGEPWPHLYVQQDICQPGSRMWMTAPTIANLERLDLNVSVRLLYDHQNRGPQFNPDVHAAQFQFFLSVQNLNTKSKGFSDYYWFGVSLYDDRREVTSLFAMQDVSQAHKKGTEKFIYDVGLAPFTSQVVAKGNWVAVRGDLLPHIRAGLDECWKRGFLPDSKDLTDYRIGGIFLGWEIPGLNDTAIAVTGLSLTATLKTKWGASFSPTGQGDDVADQDRSPHTSASLERRAVVGSFIKSSAIGLGGILAAQTARSAEPITPPHSVPETVFHAKSFGAKGDGATDDTEAINACISACGSKGGGTIHFPPGKYVISSTIPINHNHVTILGAGWGNTIFVPRQPKGDVFVFGDKTHAPVLTKMADFSIRPSVPMTSGALIHVQNGNGIILSDFEMDGGFNGLSIDDLSLQSGVHVRDFIIVNTRHAAIRIGHNSPPPYQPNEIFLTNGTISQCLVGLDLVYVDGLYVSALSIYKSSNVGVRFGPTEKTVVSDSLFVNCVTDSTISGDGWQFTGSGVTANIALDNCVTSYNRGNGVSVQPGTRLNGLGIRGGIYQFCENAGISVNSTQAKNILIQSVQVGFNSKAAQGQYAGIYFAPGVSDFTVDACMIGAVGTMTFVAKNLQGWAIMVAEGNSDGYIITNNRSVSNTAGGLRDGGSGKNKTVSGNIAVS